MDSGDGGGKIFSKGFRGDYKLPTWAAVLILLVVLLGVGFYFGFKDYWRYQVQQKEILTAQQEELALAKQEIEDLKGSGTTRRAEDILVAEPGSTLASVIKKWRPRTAHVKCLYDDDPDNPDDASGLWLSSESVVITSRHVAERPEVGGIAMPDSCGIKLPGDEEVTVKGSDIRKNWRGHEGITSLFISTPTNLMKGTRSTLASACVSRATVGEKVVILGYPSIGSKTDITVTEGIVSGYDEKDGNAFYITSAKIDKGHSGGAAVSIEKDCYLGMPVFVRLGEVESLGRILDFSVIR